jgi:hypothetical protein
MSSADVPWSGELWFSDASTATQPGNPPSLSMISIIGFTWELPV